MEKILIVRLGAMGDVIHALPAVRTLRDTLPTAKVSWVIEESWAELLCAKGAELNAPVSSQKPLVDHVILVNTKRWRKQVLAEETRQEFAEFRRQLKQDHFDTAIDVQGSLKSAVIARMSGANARVGYANPREKWATLFYTRKAKIPGDAHVIDQAKELIQIAVGQDSVSGSVPQRASLFPIDATAEQWCEAELRKRSLNKFAILNPGAGWAAKQWPSARYGEVAKALAASGIKGVVNSGPTPEEKHVGKIVEENSNGSVQVISCSIGELISLTRKASLFIGGDTGPMHLAAALGVPVVALFGPTDPKRNGPYCVPSVVLRRQSSAVNYSHQNKSDAGLMSIQVEEVMVAARNLLANHRA